LRHVGGFYASGQQLAADYRSTALKAILAWRILKEERVLPARPAARHQSTDSLIIRPHSLRVTGMSEGVQSYTTRAAGCQQTPGCDMQPLRINLIAPEFPPDTGGMSEVSRCLATALAATDDVTVYVRPGQGVPDALFRERPVLTDNLNRDIRRLAESEPDLWLVLNAGLVPLAARLREPFFAYFHGNDFLWPWIPYGPVCLESIPGPYMPPLRTLFRRRAINRGLRSAKLVFANSRNTAELISSRYAIEPSRICVCPPGVDDAFFQGSTRRPGQPLKILTVASYKQATHRKNLDGVLHALALLADRTIQYTIVGDVYDTPRLERLARELGIADRVFFLGRVERDQLLECYAKSDLFVLASKASSRDVEGFGIVYLEASAAGVPVICSRQGGATDAVEDGTNGLLIPSSDPEDIAAGIERFIAGRDQFRPERVREFAERFRWSRIATRLRGEMLSRL
jgi:glycosyltransferase involved in cell wall biosynthesis